MHIARQLVLAVLIAGAIVLSWFVPLEPRAVELVDAGLNRALISFASARALNAAISVAQGTEVSMQPFGLGVNFAPGQLLDPVNDVVEQFADWMMAASIVFGVQKVLISLGAYWAISLLLTLAALALGWMQFTQRSLPAWLLRLVVVLVVVRFGIPVATLGSELVFQKFLARDYETSQQVISAASGHVGQLQAPLTDAADAPGMLERMQGWWSSNSDVKLNFERFREAAERATEHIIKVIVIFLLETLVVPLLFLWALYAIVRGALEAPGIARRTEPIR